LADLELITSIVKNRPMRTISFISKFAKGQIERNKRVAEVTTTRRWWLLLPFWEWW